MQFVHAWTRHFGSDNSDKRTRHKGRNSAVQSNQSSWAGQYKKCAQYDLKFTPVYSVELTTIGKHL